MPSSPDGSSLDEEDSLLISPVKNLPAKSSRNQTNSQDIRSDAQGDGKINKSSEESRDARLRRELASVRRVNIAIEGVLDSLEKAQSNMKSVDRTVHNASSLLNIWTRILSQTEHNQRLILDPTWKGTSQDIADMEEEAVAKQQLAERREAEELERRAAVARRLEEEELKRAEAATKPKSIVKGRLGSGRVVGSGRTANTVGGSGYNAGSGTVPRGTPAGRRTAGGLARGMRGNRGRG